MQTDLESLIGQNSLLKSVDLFKLIQEPRLSISQIGISKRYIQKWKSYGFINPEPAIIAPRIRYSFVDFFWIKIIESLRSIGVHGEIIRKLKTDFFEKIDLVIIYEYLKVNRHLLDKLSEAERVQVNQIIDHDEHKQLNEGIPQLTLIIMDMILHRISLRLAVFTDASWMLISENNPNYPKQEYDKHSTKPHVIISLTGIISAFLQNENIMTLLSDLSILSKEEIQLLEIINSGKYTSVKVNFTDKKISSFEMEQQQDVKKRIVDILSEGSFQKISIQKHNGNVVNIKNTIKIKL